MALARVPTWVAAGTPWALSSWSTLVRDRELLWKQRDALWFAVHKERGPTVGTLYIGSMKMPVIGQQTFMLRILSRSRAQIVLMGALNLDEPAKYSIHKGSSTVEIEFNEPTIDLLRRWRTRIRTVSYFHEDDTCELVIAPPLVPAIRVRLRSSEQRGAQNR